MPPGLPLREVDEPYGMFTAFRAILRCCRLDFDTVLSLPLVLACANKVETRCVRSASIAASDDGAEEEAKTRLFCACFCCCCVFLLCSFCSPDDSPTQKSGKSGNPGTPLMLLPQLPPPLVFAGADIGASPSAVVYRPRWSFFGRAKLYHGASTVAGPMDRLAVAARASSSSTDADGGGSWGGGGGFKGRAGGTSTAPIDGSDDDEEEADEEQLLSIFITLRVFELCERDVWHVRQALPNDSPSQEK